MTVQLDMLTRREAIQRVCALLGGTALVGQSAMLAGCVSSAVRPAGSAFTSDEVALLDEIADTILPETSTPGAKAAGVGPFIALMVADTYDERDRQVFKDGLRTLDAECMRMHGQPFMASAPAQRLALLEQVDVEQMEHMRTRASGAPAHYFRMMKELSLLGYFTSEIGCTQALRYTEAPGRFDPCVPYAPGEKAWAAHA